MARRIGEPTAGTVIGKLVTLSLLPVTLTWSARARHCRPGLMEMVPADPWGKTAWRGSKPSPVCPPIESYRSYVCRKYDQVPASLQVEIDRGTSRILIAAFTTLICQVIAAIETTFSSQPRRGLPPHRLKC